MPISASLRSISTFDSEINQHTDIEAYLHIHETKGLLRFITCGSVDDGKSSLIGRLLYETKMIFEDQLMALSVDSQKFGTTGEALDLALLMDGLSAEREQGITIDVAYRFFSTAKRKFIVADTPGHEQYTRNMATGASTADLAIVMIDARKGVLTQTRRHSFIVSMLGVKHIVLAINKMDLVDYDENVFNRIENEYRSFIHSLDEDLGLKSKNITIQAIPVSALKGDNVVEVSPHMPWYKEQTLLDYLETINLSPQKDTSCFRMPVQWVNRPNLDFRGFSGRIASGIVKPGDPITVLPSGKETSVAKIVTYDGDLPIATHGQSITLTLNDEVDISRGDVLVSDDQSCEIADQFEAQLLWMSEKPLIPGRQYILKHGTATALATINKPKYRIDINDLKHIAVHDLHLNEIGLCDLVLDRPLAFVSYAENRTLGGFILIDRITNETVAAGMITHSLRRSTNVHQQNITIDPSARSSLKNHKPHVLWFTGLSGSGKSTIANCVEKKLHLLGKHTILLDGDNIRRGLNRDLGFTEQDRVENIRRIIEVAKLMVDAGLIALVSFISPYRSEREMARTLIGADNFMEIFVDTPLEIAESRDVKGLYKKARLGEIPNFTGISSPYEVPRTPDLRLETNLHSVDTLSTVVINLLNDRKII